MARALSIPCLEAAGVYLQVLRAGHHLQDGIPEKGRHLRAVHPAHSHPHRCGLLSQEIA